MPLNLRFPLALLAASLGFSASLSAAQAELSLASPDGSVVASVSTDASAQLIYSVRFGGSVAVEPSPVGATVDGVELGAGVELGQPGFGEIDETYSTLGARRQVRNRARTLSLPVLHRASGLRYVLEARASDDGFAWRIVLDGEKRRVVTGEASSWTLPAGSKVWYFERNSDWKLKSYAGEWLRCDIDRLPSVSKQGPVQGPPLVAELPGGGYALISEAALYNYSGLRLRALSGRRLEADFTEGAKGFVVEGRLVTPWRLTLLARDLDALVRSDLVLNLNPAPDPALFPDTSYVVPGRSAWSWWSRGVGTLAQEKESVDQAAALDFEYTLIDDGWKRWSDPWKDAAALSAYARSRGVRTLFWCDSKDIADPSDGYRAARDYLDRLRAAGAAGVKIDFFNAESKDKIDLQTTLLREAAKRRLLMVFHGVQKPTGEARTYPNEITREGVRGLELNRMSEGPIPAFHNAALPFTRFVVGHGDYTPLSYSLPGPTTWAHQLATFVAFTSPIQVLAEDPEVALKDPRARPALDILKAVPTTWDETRALPKSSIGELALLARRSGDVWYVAALNGSAAKAAHPELALTFLPQGTYRGILLTSPKRIGFERQELAILDASSRLKLDLAPGDGAVLVLSPISKAFVPGELWRDTLGRPINAHGGGVLFHEGRYYWYGEHKIPGLSEKEHADGGVHCYSSTDLYNWTDEGIVLPVDFSRTEGDLAAGCILERPKVLYDSSAKAFVMAFKYYPRGTGYDTGYLGLAKATSPTGPFVFVRKIVGEGLPKGSGDFALFRDTDGGVYHLGVRKPDKVFSFARLAGDMLAVDGSYRPLLGVELHTEAPAVVLRDSRYYLLGSGSTGWKPNEPRAFVAQALGGPYERLPNPAEGRNPRNGLDASVCFGGQLSFILPVEGRKDAYIALFDLWKPEAPSEGRYLWLPLVFENGRPVIAWRDRWDLSVFDAR